MYQQIRWMDQGRAAFLICFGLLAFVSGLYIGDAIQSSHAWSDGYKTGYGRCEIDFWIEQKATLERRK
jgi:hypothetical protein